MGQKSVDGLLEVVGGLDYVGGAAVAACGGGSSQTAQSADTELGARTELTTQLVDVGKGGAALLAQMPAPPHTQPDARWTVHETTGRSAQDRPRKRADDRAPRSGRAHAAVRLALLVRAAALLPRRSGTRVVHRDMAATGEGERGRRAADKNARYGHARFDHELAADQWLTVIKRLRGLLHPPGATRPRQRAGQVHASCDPRGGPAIRSSRSRAATALTSWTRPPVSAAARS